MVYTVAVNGSATVDGIYTACQTRLPRFHPLGVALETDQSADELALRKKKSLAPGDRGVWPAGKWCTFIVLLQLKHMLVCVTEFSSNKHTA